MNRGWAIGCETIYAFIYRTAQKAVSGLQTAPSRVLANG